jgi:geranylgeranyl reductase family protein
MADLRCDLLVIGAGPGGSSLAAAAAQRGLDVILVEASRHPRPKACAEYASPRIVEELGRIGLPPDAWSPAAVPLEGMRLFIDGIGGAPASDLRYVDAAGARSAWGLDRRAFDALLAAHAAASGARLLEETRLVTLLHEGDRVAGAQLRGVDGDLRVVARGVVGADGARSRTARLLGVERAVRFPRRLGLVAHYSGLEELRRHGEMHVGRGLYIGLAPAPNGELNVGMALPMAGGKTSGRAEDRFEAAIASLPRVARRLAHARRLTPIRGAAPIGHRVSDVAGPGWMLIGDAAGFVDPFTGEGIFRALRSARAAIDALAATDPEAAYRAARHRAFSAKDALTWTVQSLLAAPPLLRYAGRRLATRDAPRLRFASALGDCRRASDVLEPRALWALLRP